MKPAVSALKEKAVAALTAASQKSELIKEIESIFDKAIVYLTQTENHCKHLSNMQMDTKEKIEQSANEWRGLGQAHLAAMQAIEAAKSGIDKAMCSL